MQHRKPPDGPPRCTGRLPPLEGGITAYRSTRGEGSTRRASHHTAGREQDTSHDETFGGAPGLRGRPSQRLNNHIILCTLCTLAGRSRTDRPSSNYQAILSHPGFTGKESFGGERGGGGSFGLWVSGLQLCREPSPGPFLTKSSRTFASWPTRSRIRSSR